METIRTLSLLKTEAKVQIAVMHPTFFLNHGGGPCFFLEPGPMRAAWSQLEAYLSDFGEALGARPRAIVVISGHWEEDVPTVNSGTHPSLLFDYSGFPAHTYKLSWPAPGEPSLAGRVRDLLSAAGIRSDSEPARGWDHGIFVPLKVMYPAADIPVVQLSLQRGLDPAAHLAIGKALRPLRSEGVLILGSGQSYHNMRGFSGRAASDPGAEAFDRWLRENMADADARDAALLRWEDAPGAREAQPREDHLLPLMVAAGAASGDAGALHFHDRILGKPISGFRFG